MRRLSADEGVGDKERFMPEDVDSIVQFGLRYHRVDTRVGVFKRFASFGFGFRSNLEHRLEVSIHPSNDASDGNRGTLLPACWTTGREIAGGQEPLPACISPCTLPSTFFFANRSRFTSILLSFVFTRDRIDRPGLRSAYHVPYSTPLRRQPSNALQLKFSRARLATFSTVGFKVYF